MTTLRLAVAAGAPVATTDAARESGASMGPLNPELPNGVRRVSSEIRYSGRIFDVVRDRVILPSGLEQTLDLVSHGGAVAVGACDAAGRLLLVRQYRHAVADWMFEVPAGRLETGEDPLTAAQRELEEETGHRAGSWSPLRRVIPAPGFCSERLHLFLASELTAVPGGGASADPDEEIEVVWRTPEEVWNDPSIEDAKTLVIAAHLCRLRG